MSAPFANRTKPKTIGQDETDEDGTGPIVKRPSRPKQRSSRVRLELGADNEDEEPVSIIKPRRVGGLKSGLSRSTATERLPVRQLGDDARPSYTKEALAELKIAQQHAQSTDPQNSSTSRDLEVANKFGTTLATYESRNSSSLIPTDAEIQEKKERRARLAKLAKHDIEPDDSDDADGDERPQQTNSDEDEFLTQRDRITLREARENRSKESETRLMRDDEDLMEGFETFTGEDARVALGQGAQQEAHAKYRAHIRDMLDAAQQESEAEDEDDVDDEERDMRNEYEAMQTRAGMESSRAGARGHRRLDHRDGARTPPRITPIPTLTSCIERLRGKLLDMEADRASKVRRMEELGAEKRDIAQREIDVQTLLKEAAQKYEALSREAGISIDSPAVVDFGGLLEQPPMQAESTG